MNSTAQDFLHTHQRILPYIHRTPVLTSETINQISGAEVYFKCERISKMATKMRGAANAILQLTDEQRAKGVATHSETSHKRFPRRKRNGRKSIHRHAL
ncbi:MAG: hypothetical protein R2788_24105 [Saprospiraceae bacterium]